jgi:hypothetical protein
MDNAGFFHKPGNLGYLDITSLTIHADLYGIVNSRVENAIGERADFKVLRFNTAHLLIYGSIQTKSKWNVSYGLLTPVRFNFNGVARIEGEFEIAGDEISPDLEEIVSESGIIAKLQETTVAIGVGRKLSPNLGFEISLLNSLRTVNYSYRFAAKTITNSDDQL